MFWITVVMFACYIVIWKQLIHESPLTARRLMLTSHIAAVGITIGIIAVCLVAAAAFQVRVIAENVTIVDRLIAVVFSILTCSFLIGLALVSRKSREKRDATKEGDKAERKDKEG